MKTTFAALGLAAFVPPASADEILYRWRDDNGVMQYTETPPVDGRRFKREIVRAPGSAPAEEPEASVTPDDISRIELPGNEKEIAKEKARLAREARQRCSDARAALTRYQNTPPIRMTKTDDAGNISRLTTEEHARQMDEFRQIIKLDCAQG